MSEWRVNDSVTQITRQWFPHHYFQLTPDKVTALWRVDKPKLAQRSLQEIKIVF